MQTRLKQGRAALSPTTSAGPPAASGISSMRAGPPGHYIKARGHTYTTKQQGCSNRAGHATLCTPATPCRKTIAPPCTLLTTAYVQACLKKKQAQICIADRPINQTQPSPTHTCSLPMQNHRAQPIPPVTRAPVHPHVPVGHAVGVTQLWL